MGAHQQYAGNPLSARDRIECKLRAAVSLIAMLSGEGRQAFLDLTPEMQDGFIDALFELIESARLCNIPA